LFCLQLPCFMVSPRQFSTNQEEKIEKFKNKTLIMWLSFCWHKKLTRFPSWLPSVLLMTQDTNSIFGPEGLSRLSAHDCIKLPLHSRSPCWHTKPPKPSPCEQMPGIYLKSKHYRQLSVKLEEIKVGWWILNVGKNCRI